MVLILISSTPIDTHLLYRTTTGSLVNFLKMTTYVHSSFADFEDDKSLNETREERIRYDQQMQDHLRRAWKKSNGAGMDAKDKSKADAVAATNRPPVPLFDDPPFEADPSAVPAPLTKKKENMPNPSHAPILAAPQVLDITLSPVSASPSSQLPGLRSTRTTARTDMQTSKAMERALKEFEKFRKSSGISNDPGNREIKGKIKGTTRTRGSATLINIKSKTFADLRCAVVMSPNAATGALPGRWRIVSFSIACLRICSQDQLTHLCTILVHLDS